MNIPPNHIVSDELHLQLLLRITDILTEALITTAIACDRYEYHTQTQRCRHGYLKAYKITDGKMLNNMAGSLKYGLRRKRRQGEAAVDISYIGGSLVSIEEY